MCGSPAEMNYTQYVHWKNDNRNIFFHIFTMNERFNTLHDYIQMAAFVHAWAFCL